VDDEPDIVDLFQRQFRKELRNGEYVMHFAASAEGALELLDNGVEPEIMLILSDINMPGMSGIDLLNRSKQRWPNLSVAMITAYGDEETERSAMEGGATAFINKPIDFSNLKDLIAEMRAARSG
jgi:two-component system, response regulator, stage 0 sporulation protein F